MSLSLFFLENYCTKLIKYAIIVWKLCEEGIYMEHRIHVIVGHYGSGKTEFAINYALSLKESYEKVYIVDLDIVNPYFRTNDERKKLEELGISVIASPYASTNVDVPSLPADIYRVFAEKDAAVVFDVGGDDDGAIALGRYKQYFDAEPPEMLFVINVFRPQTADCSSVMDMITNIEVVSRLKVTGLVNSSNLAALTTEKELITGQAVTDEVSGKTGIPCRYAVGLASVLEKLPESFSAKTFRIDRFMSLKF